MTTRLGSLTVVWSLLQQLLLSLSLLKSEAILALQPTLSWLVDISLLVLLELWEEGSKAADSSSLALLWRMVTRGHPSERWTRRKEREQVWWEFVSHLNY